MKRLQLFAATALCAATVMPAIQSGAQGTGALKDQPVPRELVEALVSGGMTRAAPSIVVDELPPTLAGKVFVPPGARILGGSYSNVGATGVLVSSSRPDSLIAMYKRELPKQGWSPFAPPTQASYMTWGFVDAPGSSSSTSSMAALSLMGGMGSMGPAVETLTYCGLGTTLIVQIDPVGFTDSRIKISTSGSNICAMMAQQTAQITAMRVSSGDPSAAFARPPILTNPNNARDTGGCPRSNSSGPVSSTKLNTTMTSDELFAHYAKQMADSGWSPMTTTTTVTREWTRTDTAGTTRIVDIHIRTVADASTCRELDMNMRTIPKR